jgi:hypothetical protein
MHKLKEKFIVFEILLLMMMIAKEIIVKKTELGG